MGTHRTQSVDRSNRRVISLAACAALATASACTRASALYFDTNGLSPGSGIVPATSYTWTTSSETWTTDPAGASDVQTWDPSATAIFSAGADAAATTLFNIRSIFSAGGLVAEDGNITINAVGSAFLSLTGGTIYVPAANQVLTIKSPIGGTTFTKTGPGTLTLTSISNTFTGGFAVTGGTLQFTGENILSGTLPSRTGASPGMFVPDYVRLDGGAIQDNSTIATPTFLNSNKGITLGATGGTIDIADSSTSNPHTYAGVITGPGSLTKTGPGLLQLGSQPSTYTGATTVSLGTLRLGGHNVLPTGTTLAVASGATTDLAGFNQTVASLTGTGKVTNAGRLTVTPTADSTWSGVISGTGGLTAAGPAFVLLAATQTYTGPTQIAGSFPTPFGIKLAAPGVLPASPELQFNPTSADASPTLDLNGFNQTLITITNLNPGLGHPAITNSSPTQATLTLNNTAAPVNVAITGSIALTKSGTSTALLTATNTYSGPTRITSGTLAISNTAQLGNASPSNTILLDGGTLRTDATFSTSRAISVLIAGGTVNTNGFSPTFSGPVTGPGVLTKSGPGTLTLGPLSLSGLIINSGQLRLIPGAGTSSLGSLTISPGAQFDAADNRLVLTGLTPATVASLLAAGRFGAAPGDWQGVTGIASSAAADDPGKSTGIGYATAAQLGVTSWGSATGLTGSETLTMYTYYGDLNLDGKIDADDYARIDRSLAKGGLAGSAAWLDGDVNYDRSVTAADYLLLDRAFALHGGTLSADLLSQRESRFGSDYVTYLITSVPEPTLPVVTAATLLFAPTRRRRPQHI